LESPLSPKQDIIEQLLSERESLEALEQAAVKARKLGVSEQAILEAKFLFHVDRAEDAEIAALLPRFIKQRDQFKLADSEIFGSEDDWLAVVEYVHAIAAMEKGDKSAFKHHITEAFWLSPRQGAVFAPHIDRVRLLDAMKKVRVDLAEPFSDILEAKTASLGELVAGYDGLLLHFWSPLSPECEATLSDFFVTAESLIENRVAVVSILPETSEKVVAAAKSMLAGTKRDVPGKWIVDSTESPVTETLRIQTLPTVVLLSKEGRVLFNGHPTNGDFWEALKTLNPAIVRPEAKEE